MDKTIFFLKRVYTETPHLRIRTSCLPPSAKDVDIWVREVCCENTLDHKVLEIPTCIKRSLIKKKFVKKIYNTGTDWRSAPNNAINKIVHFQSQICYEKSVQINFEEHTFSFKEILQYQKKSPSIMILHKRKSKSYNTYKLVGMIF